MHGEGPYAADGFLFTPTGPNVPGSLLVIPGRSGVSAAVELAAQNLADAGYRVVLLDPNRGGPQDSAPSKEQTWEDIGAALKFLDGQSLDHSLGIGVLGVGEGASMALRLARERLVKAAAIESCDLPEPADLPNAAPLLASVARLERPLPSRAHRNFDRIDFYKTCQSGAGDRNALFDSADLVKIRQEELKFFAQHLGARQGLPQSPADVRRED